MPTSLVEDRTNRQMNRKSGAARSLSAQGFTEKQGQYLAFIYTYSHMFRRPPAETDMQRHFQVSPPSVHQMIVTLERNGLIRRQAHRARGADSPRHSACPYAASRIPGNIAYLAPWTEYRVPNVETRYRVYVGLPE